MARWSASPLFVVCAVAAGLGALPMQSAATESAGSLVVTVKDNAGVLRGATVYLIGDDQATRAAGTDAAGTARFASLPNGTYQLRASLVGFADGVVSGVALAADENKAVEVVLSQVQFSTSVTVTTANRREELLLDVTEPTLLLDRSQLEDTGARTAKDVLVEQAGSGVQVAAGGGQGHISINGIPNSGVLVLIDGRRYLGRDGIGNLNIADIDMSGFERVEVVRGAGSALYGSDALGGVVNFISKKRSLPGLDNTLTLSGGSFGDLKAMDTASYRGTRGGLGLTAGYRTYDGFDLDEKNPQTVGQPESQWTTVSGNADFGLGRKAFVRFLGDFSRRDIDNYFFSGATQLARDVYNSVRELTRYTLAPQLEFLPTAATAITASFTHGKYRREETRIYPNRATNATVPIAPWLEWNDEARATLRQTWRALDQEQPLQLGYEFRRETMDRASLKFPESGKTRAERDIQVLWAQQELNPIRWLKLTGGFRYDDYSDFGGAFSPKVGLLVSVAAQHRIRSSFGEGFRAPSFGELYLDTPPFFKGNPNLKPERSKTLSGGYTFAGRRFEASVDLFRAEVEDGIVFSQVTPVSYTYLNLRRYTATGANTAVAASLPLGFTPSASYTYVKRKDDQGTEIGGVPKHAAFLKLLWANPRLGLRTNLRGQWNDDVFFDDGTSQPAYGVWYAQISKRFARSGRYALTVSAQVDNLFDKRDVFRVSRQGQPIPGDFQVWLSPRTFLVSVTLGGDWPR
jgi:outer membrane receptor for ferrienterochelin and colicins